MPNGTLQLVYILNSDTSSTSDIWNRHQKIFGWINTFYNFLFSAILAAAFFFIKCILLSAVIIELEGAEDFPDDDDDDERDDLLLPLLLFPPLFVPVFSRTWHIWHNTTLDGDHWHLGLWQEVCGTPGGTGSGIPGIPQGDCVGWPQSSCKQCSWCHPLSP